MPMIRSRMSAFFLVGCFHEAGQIEGQRLDKSVQQLLAAAAAGGVGDGQTGILALALHHNAVGEPDLEVGGSHSTVPLGGVRAEFFAAKRPCQRVENAGLALIVVAAHEGETGGAGVSATALMRLTFSASRVVMVTDIWIPPLERMRCV